MSEPTPKVPLWSQREAEVPETSKVELSESPDRDFYGWLLDQASRLRLRRPDLDWDNLAEELDAMAKSEERALVSHLETLLAHLLKWQWQSKARRPGWEASIANARDRIRQLLVDSPSLKSKLSESVNRAYGYARRLAGSEMGWSKRDWDLRFERDCPWSFEIFMGDDFWPAEESNDQ